MNGRGFVFAWFLMLVLTVGAEAGVVPGKWEKVGVQPAGTQLLVTLRSGQEIHCVLRSLTEESLTVVDPVAGVMELSKMSVSRVSSWEKRSDGNSNGLLIGAGVGTLLGALSAGEVEVAGGNGAASIASSAGLCALIGYLVDKAHKKPELLYAAPRE